VLPAWQHESENEQRHELQPRGSKLKLTHAPERQTWLTLPPRLELKTQRHVSAGTPAHESPPLPLPPCP